MNSKNRLFRLIPVFLGSIVVFSVIFLLSPIPVESEQVGQLETAVNGIESHSSVITKTEVSNPFGILSANATAMDGDVEVTVYNGDLALVKEKRELEFDAGVNRIEYTDVAARIEPTSVMFEDPTDENTVVLEQNYEYDLVSSSKLLEKFLGKEIIVTDEEGTDYTGTLLSNDGGVVLRQEDGTVVTLNKISKVEFPDSANLLTKPTLVWEIYSPNAGNRDVLTSYLTEGLDWEADYIVKASADDTKANITGWVSIENRAGTTYEDAKLKLVAGDVHRVPKSSGRLQLKEGNMDMNTTCFAGFYCDLSEETLFEYHLYTLERPATLKDRQIKQISLLSADSVPLEKELVFDSRQSDKVQAYLKIENSEKKGLGMPLPAGTVRVYKADSEGQLQFLGEDNIDHTPKDEEIKVVVGNAFDVTAEKTSTDYKKVSDKVRRESYEIKLKNHKTEAQNVTVMEHFYGDWEITKTSDEYEKTDAFTAEWTLTVPADGEKIISYTVETRDRILYR